VIGVEAAAGMTTSLQQNKIVTLDSVGLFADGALLSRQLEQKPFVSVVN
jgi:hypothetical protein